jgi:hypothetical protein
VGIVKADVGLKMVESGKLVKQEILIFNLTLPFL